MIARTNYHIFKMCIYQILCGLNWKYVIYRFRKITNLIHVVLIPYWSKLCLINVAQFFQSGSYYVRWTIIFNENFVLLKNIFDKKLHPKQKEHWCHVGFLRKEKPRNGFASLIPAWLKPLIIISWSLHKWS